MFRNNIYSQTSKSHQVRMLHLINHYLKMRLQQLLVKKLKIALRLESFRILMSFLGSIKTQIESTGIEKLMEVKHAKHSVNHEFTRP